MKEKKYCNRYSQSINRTEKGYLEMKLIELFFDDENSFKYELWLGMKPLMLMEGFPSSCVVSIQLIFASMVHCTEKLCSLLLLVKQCCKHKGFHH